MLGPVFPSTYNHETPREKLVRLVECKEDLVHNALQFKAIGRANKASVIEAREELKRKYGG